LVTVLKSISKCKSSQILERSIHVIDAVAILASAVRQCRLKYQLQRWCCPVSERLGKQLSRKIFCLVGIFKELEQALLVCHGGSYWVES